MCSGGTHSIIDCADAVRIYDLVFDLQFYDRTHLAIVDAFFIGCCTVHCIEAVVVLGWLLPHLRSTVTKPLGLIFSTTVPIFAVVRILSFWE